MKSLLYFCVVSALSASLAVAEQQNQRLLDLACIDSLELPSRGVMLRGGDAGGTVTADIHIKGGNAPADYKLTGGDNFLKAEVGIAIELSQFADSCKGRTIQLVYTFILKGPPVTSALPAVVRFKPPNTFELEFRQTRAIID